MPKRDFPPRRPGLVYLTEGGTETEVLYKWGFELPEFAMFTLLGNPEADSVIEKIYDGYFDAAAATGAGMLLNAHDYRASPDWASKLGYGAEDLTDIQQRVIAFLDRLRTKHAGRVRDVYIAGCIGPRGDAYGTGGEITEDEAEAYHAVQIGNLCGTNADMATALTFNNVAEAVGLIRAARAAGLPVGVSFNLGPDGRLRSGPSLAEAITETDAATDGAAEWFGTNCSHPDEFAPALAEPGAWRERLRYIRPNAARTDKLALCKLGHLEDGDPVELGRQMAEAVRAFPNVDIVGGCCGTDERHLREVSARVQEVRREAA